MEKWPELTAFARCIDLQSISWNKEGRKLIQQKKKVLFTYKERKIIKSLLVQTIPEDLRKEYWLIASGAKREINNHPNYYSSITTHYPNEIPSPYKSQIELDLARTFPDDNFFKEQSNIDKLSNILLAYSRRSITIGYCQGFNFIVGKILKICGSEEETFWVFTQIIEQLLPINYYCELAELMTDCTILTKLLQLYASEVFYHLHRIKAEMYLSNILYRWLMSLFIQNTSDAFWVTIWDLFLLEGNIVLFKSAIAIMKLTSKDLLEITASGEVQEYFNERIKNKTDTKLLLYYLLVKRFDFNIKIIKRNREEILPKVIEGIKANSGYSFKKTNKNKCNLKWPLCSDDVEFRHDILRFFVYKPLYAPRMLKNYFDVNTDREAMSEYYNNIDNNEEQTEEEKKTKQFEALLVERRKHLCEEKIKENKKSSFIINDSNDYGNLFEMNFEKKELECSLMVQELFQSTFHFINVIR